MRRLLSLALLLLPLAARADEPWRVLDGKSTDKRLASTVTLNDYFPFNPPKSKDEWESRRKAVREQLLVATGLWPMPEKTPLNPVVHGAIDRDEYTVEKVFFVSMPGHYVTGNLYHPRNKSGKCAGVLCPDGHWANGRMHDAGEKAAKELIANKGEQTMEGARYHLQARCAMLARMGCVVFHYDMVGVADSKAIPHAAGFADVQGELRLQSAMGLQTWNSIRALDFLVSLPDVDATRIGCTGASGGGTQTFMLCGIDDRVTAAFPAVMVGTGMQGGCVCENCSYLRIGSGNVEIAGLFAPKPLGMSGANDWTKDIETKGLPELKALYKLYGVEENVMAKCHPEFDHNYNQVSREMMYNWFNKHLKLGSKEPVAEKPFKPIPPKELSVFDADHPMPKDALPVGRLRQAMAEASDKQIDALFPKDAAGLAEFRNVIGTALRVMVGEFPAKDQIVVHVGPKVSKLGDNQVHKVVFGRKGEGDRVPSMGIVPADHAPNTIAIWVHPKGKASLFDGDKIAPAAQAFLDKKISVMAIDMLQCGEQSGLQRKVSGTYAGYTYGYNRPLLADQSRDIVTAVALAKNVIGAKTVYLVGWGEAGPAVVLGRAACGDAVARTAADLHQFRFDTIEKTDDPRMLPGGVKYGGLAAFTALCAPGEMFFHNHAGTSSGKITKAAYAAAGADDKLKRQPKPAKAEDVVEWLTR